jgi:signal transduction histidine kinase
MRTPLARIRFALALIGNEASDDARKQLALINDDVQEIDDLIATMLNYARLDHPDLQMDWRQSPGWSRRPTSITAPASASSSSANPGSMRR